MDQEGFTKAVCGIGSVVSVLSALVLIGYGLWNRNLEHIGFGVWVIASVILTAIAVDT